MTNPKPEDAVREAFEQQFVESGLYFGQHENDAYEIVYSSDLTQATFMGYQAALSSPDVVKLVEAAATAANDLEVLECHCDGGQCNRCHGFVVLQQALAPLTTNLQTGGGNG